MTFATPNDLAVDTVGFLERWRHPPTFRVDPDLYAPTYTFPPTVELLDELRRDTHTKVTVLADDPATRTAMSTAFPYAEIDEVITWPFRLVHFDLHRLYTGLLTGFHEEVMIPWRIRLASLGFTWQRCYPILFISTRGSSSTYHVDHSNGLVWQVDGVKTFNTLCKPQRYAPFREAVRGRISAEKPPAFDEVDKHTIMMRPGDLAWNHILTPHWVTAESQLTLSVNISHGGLAREGSFTELEEQLRAYWDRNPDLPWLSDLSHIRY